MPFCATCTSSLSSGAVLPPPFAGSRLLKVREEADPFSMDIGALRKGDIVKVLEVSRVNLSRS